MALLPLVLSAAVPFRLPFEAQSLLDTLGIENLDLTVRFSH
jgi:hypothetical protein